MTTQGLALAFQKPVVVQSVLAHFTYEQFHKAVPWYTKACYTQRSWLKSEKYEGKKGWFCFWEQGWTTQLNAMLDRIWVLTLCKTWTLYTPSWKTEAVLCTISIYLLFLFLSWSKIPPFKSWQIKFPPTQSVKELHCCCVSPAVSTLTGMVW